MQTKHVTYSIILPIYNEASIIRELFRRMQQLLDSLDAPSEVILVNDGSHDESYPLLVELHELDKRFKVIDLSRNFGHQLAITAGMDAALGQAIIIMDADLQDPPEVVKKMITKWHEGYEIVYAVRIKRKGETWFKQLTAHLFYRFLDRLTTIRIPKDTGDFRLVDRRALEAFRALRETNRYVRGMFSWIGFRQTSVEYIREERFAGVTKYPFKKMLRLALDGIISFSNVPLRIVLKIGFYFSGLSFLTGVVAIVLKLAGGYTIPGWASLVVGLSFLSGVQLFVMGMIGEYISRIYEEVKGRPLYIVSHLHGLETTHPLGRAVVSHEPRGE